MDLYPSSKQSGNGLHQQAFLFFTSFGIDDMRARSEPIAGFILPYKCYELRKLDQCKYGYDARGEWCIMGTSEHSHSALWEQGALWVNWSIGETLWHCGYIMVFWVHKGIVGT